MPEPAPVTTATRCRSSTRGDVAMAPDHPPTSVIAVQTTPMTDPAEGSPASGSAPETDRGRALFEELLWVHAAIRRDLRIVERLAADVEEGLAGEAVRDALEELKTTGPLWQLKGSWLRYCRLV